MEDEKVMEIVHIMGDFVARVDAENKRLVRTIAIGIVAFAATITICFGILYTSNYEVSMQQQQMFSNGMQQQQK